MTPKQMQAISEDVVKYLNKAFAIRREVAAKRAQLEMLEALAESTTARLSQVPGGGGGTTSDKVANGVMAILEKKDEIGVSLYQLVEALREIELAIRELVKDEKSRAVLEARYLACLPWDEVAERLEMTRRWAMTLHERATKEMLVNCLLIIFESA